MNYLQAALYLLQREKRLLAVKEMKYLMEKEKLVNFSNARNPEVAITSVLNKHIHKQTQQENLELKIKLVAPGIYTSTQ